ncbi:amidase family protein [Mycobacterium kansasii 662]|uniref:Amidase family protein n=1 Tax=Mycobacterium kansasii 662 TaxID=1299326 RepID=X7XS76_MYCKA|nr:amidase family protein [Mycobacterium kansasii 662]
MPDPGAGAAAAPGPSTAASPFRRSWGTPSERTHPLRRRHAAARVAAKELSSTELTQACLDQIAANRRPLPRLPACRRRPGFERRGAVDQALAAGETLPSPLAGVPLALKDVFTTIDMPTTCGSKILQDWRSPYDATVTARLRAAGIPILGKTNMDEFAMGSSTENSAYGPTRNPWNVDRVPGAPAGAARRRWPHSRRRWPSGPTTGVRSGSRPRSRRPSASNRPTGRCRGYGAGGLRVVAGSGRPLCAHGAGYRAAATR